jgi:hypothetical protein
VNARSVASAPGNARDALRSGACWSAVALLLAAIIARDALERSMFAHMVVQIPMLLGAGVLLAAAMGRQGDAPRADATRGYNAYGIAGLLLAGGIVATWMVPRALDAAVEHAAWDSGKFGTLVAAGVLAHWSWWRASTIVRAFFVGNGLWMNATVGLLIVDAPARLCTSYTTNDQSRAGYALVGITIGIAVVAAVFADRWLADGPDRSPLRHER